MSISISVGVLCAAPMFNSWFRAQVVSVFEESDECDIRYVDYGGYARVSSSCLRQIRSVNFQIQYLMRLYISQDIY